MTRINLCWVPTVKGDKLRKLGKDEQDEDIFKMLSHPIRRAIIKILYERVELSYSELLREVKVEEGLFNFHLRNMRPLIELTEDKTYILSRKGKLAYELIRKVEQETPLHSAMLTPPKVTVGILLRRAAAFLIDLLIFIIATGVFLDPNFYHLIQLHIADIQRHSTEIILAYSHIFFAAFIVFTLLESYKGQTIGKYITRIRVLTITDRRLSLVESGIRNMGKVFLLPIDVLIGLFYIKRGYVRFFDYYIRCKTEIV